MRFSPRQADLLARLAYVVSPVMTRVSKQVRFPEIRVPSELTAVRTRFGVVTARIYRPDVPAGDRPLPLLVNFHGGGFILGNAAQDDHVCRYLAQHTPSVVINVDYTTAPFVRHPTPIYQGLDAVRHFVENPDGWDSSRVAVLGHSAGGLLAASLARLSRDEQHPKLALQILDYPGLDWLTPPSQRKAAIPDPALPVWMLEIAQQVYLPDAAERVDPLASPALSGDLEGLPRALVISAAHDILHDEAEKYARALAAAGVPMRRHVAQGVDHAFTQRDRTETLETLGIMIEELRSAFAVAPEPDVVRERSRVSAA